VRYFASLLVRYENAVASHSLNMTRKTKKYGEIYIIKMYSPDVSTSRDQLQSI